MQPNQRSVMRLKRCST
ncbi:UNVERIFIED_CONTAM: hypothetical protein GTU68_022934 [Idotea baltica]|nr:hypothetical protein [Idotea baltica]